jgi:hypothetical protein
MRTGCDDEDAHRDGVEHVAHGCRDVGEERWRWSGGPGSWVREARRALGI